MEPAAPGTPPRRVGHFCVVHRKPVVIAAADWELADDSAALWGILAAIPRDKSYLLVQPSWVVDEGFPETALRRRIDVVRERFEHVELLLLAPTARAFEIMQDDGVPAVYCSQNALVREDIFFPMPGRRQKFDAIYDAKWADYKRHQLAGAIESLALLTYQLPQACTLEYFQMALAAVKHGTWFTRPWVPTDPFLSPPEVNAAYNQCRVGLCLSAHEGPNYASIQYLLAGLPVVTTKSIGGRDEFFRPATTRWVDDDPEAVAGAVADLCSDPVDPLRVRHETLAIVHEHRDRLRRWLVEISDEADARSRRWRAGWPPDLPAKFTDYAMSARDAVRVARQHDSSDERGWATDDAVVPRVVLGTGELARFEHDGFLVVDRPLVTANELAEVRGILDELLARFEELPSELAYDLGDVKVHDGKQQIPEVNRALDLDPRLGGTAAFARCQELAHQLLSGRAFCNFDHAIFKPPEGNTEVDWHQDLAFAPELEDVAEVHIWLALQDVDEANGCMWYVPTSRHPRLLPHRPRGNSPQAHALVAEGVDEAAAVACPIGAGMATVHKPATLHATGPNSTDQLRAAWILHFVDNGS